MYRHSIKNRQRKKSSKASRLRRGSRNNNQKFNQLDDSVLSWSGGFIKTHDSEIYSLEDWDYGRFLPIITEKNDHYHGPNPSYGGAQMWWSGKDILHTTGNGYGCGVIAATNLVIYLAQHFKQYSGLLEAPYRPLKREGYMMVADELWEDIKPYCGFKDFTYHIARDPYSEAYKFGFGVTVPKLIEGIKAYASRRSISIDFMTIKALKASDQQGVNFIKLGLLRNYPVLLLSLNNGVKQFEFHWVLITALSEDKVKGRTEITLSTWGRMKSHIDFKTLWRYNVFLENQYMVAIV